MLTNSPTAVAQFYSNDANLSWNGEHIKGKLEIHKFFKKLSKYVYQISTVDSQIMKLNYHISMLTISGYMNSPSQQSQHFVSTFYIKSIHTNQAAVILSHDFMSH